MGFILTMDINSQPSLPLSYKDHDPESENATMSNGVHQNLDQLGPPPDGGLKTWLQVVGSWVLIFNTWGTE